MRKDLGTFWAALAIVTAAIFLAAPSASADELYRDSAEVNSMMTKLGRGCANVLTGWLEIPKQIGRSIKKTDPVTGTIVGTVQGVGWGFARTVTGFFEVATFPFPIPEDYEPLLEPEYVAPGMWGAPLPVISDRDNNLRKTIRR